MARVPRYGIHDGIKYNPRRSLIRQCKICKSFFHPTGRRDITCSKECQYKNKQLHNKNWSTWFNHLPAETRQKYIGRRGNTERKKDFAAEQRDIRRLYKEAGIAYKH